MFRSTASAGQNPRRQKVDAENLVKVLCGKAMWDVLEGVPVEGGGDK